MIRKVKGFGKAMSIASMVFGLSSVTVIDAAHAQNKAQNQSSTPTKVETVQVSPSVVSAAGTPVTQEAWKGPADTHDFSAGFLGGLGIIDHTAGVSLLGTVSRKLVEPGFAPDINNGVSLELQFGPLIASGGTPLFYSAHLRWDFRRDTEWTLYGLGGVAGYVSSSINVFEFFPRFGVGALWNVHELFALRGEISHEFVGIGVNFPL
jgi:hypothetical protein